MLKIARQPYYRWIAAPVTTAEREQAYLADALFDAHRDDPEFGYRFLADEARDAGHADRGSQFRSWKFIRALHHHDMVGSMGKVGASLLTG